MPVLKRATKVMVQRPRKLAKAFRHRVILERAKCEGVKVANVSAARQPRMLFVGIGFNPSEKSVSFSLRLTFARTLKEVRCRDIE